MYILSELLTAIFLTFISYTECRHHWGNGGMGGWQGHGEGFNNGHHGYGYGSDICAGARRQQGGGGSQGFDGRGGFNNYQNYPNQFNDFGYHNNGYYREPNPPSIRNSFPVTEAAPRHTTIRTTTAPILNCSQPEIRDDGVFDQKCIYPMTSDLVQCLSQGSPSLPPGTTAITKCKGPHYYSESGDMIVEICKNGEWQRDGKSLTCKAMVIQPVVIPPPPQEPPPPPPQVKEKKRPHQYNNPIVNYVTEKAPLVFHEADPVNPDIDEDDEEDFYRMPTHRTTQAPKKVPINIDWRNHDAHRNPPVHHQQVENPHHSIQQMPQRHPDQEQNNDIYTPENGKCPPLRNKPGAILECLSKIQRNSSAGSTSNNYLLSISDCQDQQPPGTEATFKCQMYYEPISGLVTQYRKCKENGMWTGTDDGFGCKLECGKSNPGARLPLITFGDVTISGQYPWHAALFIRDRGDLSNSCGGTLISPRAVITAAHCVNLYLSSLLRDLNDIRVDLGRYYRTKDDPYVQKFQVEKIISHPAYNPFIFESDIAIIILKGTAKVGFHVRPVCYPKAMNAAFDEMQLADGSYATVVGWGVDETGGSPDELKSAKLKVIGYKECIDSFEEADTGALLAKSTTFCAGNKNGTNVCRGDSGSGAYFAVKTSSGGTRWYLQGLVSLGINVSGNDKKCDPERVSIFTRISPYSDWIVRVLSEYDAL